MERTPTYPKPILPTCSGPCKDFGQMVIFSDLFSLFCPGLLLHYLSSSQSNFLPLFICLIVWKTGFSSSLSDLLTIKYPQIFLTHALQLFPPALTPPHCHPLIHPSASNLPHSHSPPSKISHNGSLLLHQTRIDNGP